MLHRVGFVVLIGLALGVEGRPPAPLNLVGGEEGVGHPAYVLSILSDLGTLIDQRQGNEEDFPEPESDTEDYEGRKRAIDFGLGRGYSGSQVEKEERKNTKYVLNLLGPAYL